MTPGRQRGAAVEHTDVVQAEKTALEHIVAICVFFIDPPGKIEQQFVEYSF